MHAHQHTLIPRKLVSAFFEHVFAICCLRKQKLYLTFLSSGVVNTTCSQLYVCSSIVFMKFFLEKMKQLVTSPDLL